MPKGKVTFIVEGELELAFLKNQCGSKAIFRKVPSNGDDVSMECLTKMVAAIVGMGPEPEVLFVILDREHRALTALQLEQDLERRIVALSLSSKLSVHFADKMVENWIIADDEAMIKSGLQIEVGKLGTEGCGGKSKLKEAFKKKRLSYSERIDGPKLLNACSAKKLAANSPSFKRLADALKANSIECHWAAQ